MTFFSFCLEAFHACFSLRFCFIAELQPQSEQGNKQIAAVPTLLWSPGLLPDRLQLADHLQTPKCQMHVWLADYRSPEMNSLGKNYWSGFACSSAGPWVLWGGPVTHRVDACVSPTWATVGRARWTPDIHVQPASCAAGLCLRTMSLCVRLPLAAAGNTGRELWNLGRCGVRVHRQAARARGGGRWPWAWASFPSRFSPCCFAGSEADFSSSSSTGSISAPEVHMSAAGSKRSSFSRK